MGCFLIKQTKNVISSKCGKSFHCLHCSEVFWLKRNKARLNRLAESCAWSAPVEIRTKLTTLADTCRVPFGQYCHLHLCKLRWSQHSCGGGEKKCMFVTCLWEHTGKHFSLIYIFMYIFHTSDLDKHLSKDFWGTWPHLLFVNSISNLAVSFYHMMWDKLTWNL